MKQFIINAVNWVTQQYPYSKLTVFGEVYFGWIFRRKITIQHAVLLLLTQKLKLWRYTSVYEIVEKNLTQSCIACYPHWHRTNTWNYLKFKRLIFILRFAMFDLAILVTTSDKMPSFDMDKINWILTVNCCII